VMGSEASKRRAEADAPSGTDVLSLAFSAQSRGVVRVGKA
jgi:hypothetical protein